VVCRTRKLFPSLSVVKPAARKAFIHIWHLPRCVLFSYLLPWICVMLPTRNDREYERGSQEINGKILLPSFSCSSRISYPNFLTALGPGLFLSHWHILYCQWILFKTASPGFKTRSLPFEELFFFAFNVRNTLYVGSSMLRIVRTRKLL